VNDQAMHAAALQSGRIRLRPLQLSDAEAMHGIYSDPETMKYWSSEPVSQLADSQALVQQDLEAAARRDMVSWAVTLRDDDRAIGKCVLMHHSLANRRAEIGYVLNRAYWGKGLMTEALRALISHAFGALELHRLEADTDPANAGSLRLLERLGFRREGLFRERWLVYGQWQDSVMLGLLRTDWEAQR
jgi:[ribosomal protein S5]-alanine N-acetyltransferase